MKVGDRVRIIGIPDGLQPDGDDAGLNTTSLFQRCLGRDFEIVGFNEVGHVELEVGEVDGRAPYLTSIWVEPKFLAERP